MANRMTPTDEQKVADLFGIDFDPKRPPPKPPPPPPKAITRVPKPQRQVSNVIAIVLLTIGVWFLGFAMGFLAAP